MTETTKTKGELARNFTQTRKAKRIVEDAKEKGENISSFISQCIENYGPVLLGDKAGTDKSAPLAARLKYLEDVVEAWVFYDLKDRWKDDPGAKAAHKEVLEASGKKIWFKDANIQKILEIATNKKKTEKKEPWEWQTLLRRRKDFLAMK